MNGPRETALVAIANQLKTIRVENGYANDIARVFRQDFRVEQLSEGEVPAAFVLPPLQGGRLDALDAGGYVYRWPLTCGVSLKRTPTDQKEEQRETDMESLVNDIWRALLEDPTFGTTAVSGIHDSVLSDGPYFFDPDLGVGLYNCTLQVDLVFQRSDL
jgi:hypothetical protein